MWIFLSLFGRHQCTTELSGSARMFPRSSAESVSSSISPITALKQINTQVCSFCALRNPIKSAADLHNVNKQQNYQGLKYIHIIASDNIQSQNHLLYSLRRAEHPLVAFIQDEVDCLVEALQRPLRTGQYWSVQASLLKHTKTMFTQEHEKHSPQSSCHLM